MIRKAYEYRTMSDYKDFITLEKDDVLEMYDDMNKFISEMENFILK